MSRKVTYPKAGEIWSLELASGVTNHYLFLEQIPENPRHLKALNLLTGARREIVVWSEDIRLGYWRKV
jgi:hypothetical protein